MPTGLLPLFLTLFIDLLGFGIVIPILPYITVKYGGAGLTLGFLMSSYAIMQFLFSPFWGRLSDRVGRRPVLLISISGTALSMFILGAADSMVGLFVGRILGGICAANISTAYAYVTDVTDEKNRSKGMGLLGAGFALGFTLGPALGGILSKTSLALPMFFAAGLAVVNLALTFFLLPEPKRHVSHDARKPKIGLLAMLRDAPVSALGIFLFFLFSLAITQMEVTFGLYVLKRFAWTAEGTGLAMALGGLVMAGVQGGAVGRLSPRFGEAKLIIAGMFLTGVGMGLFGFSPTAGWIFAAMLLMAIGRGIAQPALSSLVSFGAAPHQAGALLGVFQSAGSLGRIVGPGIAGWSFDHLGMRAPFTISTVVAWTGAALGLKALGSVGKLKKHAQG